MESKAFELHDLRAFKQQAIDLVRSDGRAKLDPQFILPSDDEDEACLDELLITLQIPDTSKVRLNQMTLLASSTLLSLAEAVCCITSAYFPEKRLRDSTAVVIENSIYGDADQFPLINAFLLREGLASMAETAVLPITSTWYDVRLRLHTPYLYIHSSCCQHFFVIRSVRLASRVDPQSPASYPILSAHGAGAACSAARRKKRNRKCRFCDTFKATLFAVNCRLTPENPCFMCSKCYGVFFPGLQAERVERGGRVQLTGEQREAWGDLEVYPYVQI